MSICLNKYEEPREWREATTCRCALAGDVVTLNQCPAGFKNWDGSQKTNPSGSCFFGGNCYQPAKCFKSDYPTDRDSLAKCCMGETEVKNCDPSYCPTSQNCNSLINSYCSQPENINKTICYVNSEKLRQDTYKTTMTNYCKDDNLNTEGCKFFVDGIRNIVHQI